MSTQSESVREHYSPDETDLVARVIALLDQIEGPLTTKHLSAFDQFHLRGIAATKDLASLAGIRAGMHVLDAGSGLGGPSRFLAEHYNCTVTGVDLTPSFVELATLLSERTGLADRATYQVGDLLALPFPDAQFDLIWTQHVVMNIADRAQLYSEFRRVLKPAGKLAFHDIIAADHKPPLLFPVPWAETQATSFLLTKAETIAALEQAGLTPQVWIDDTDHAIAAPPPSSPGMSLAAIMGPRFPEMSANVMTNAREGRVRVVMAACSAL